MIKLFEPVQYVICYGLKYNILYIHGKYCSRITWFSIIISTKRGIQLIIHYCIFILPLMLMQD